MRKSIIKNDPGYDPQGYKYQVFLDGKQLEDCFTADEEKGEAHIYERDKGGKLIRDEYGEFSKESFHVTREKCLKGAVELRFMGSRK